MAMNEAETDLMHVLCDDHDAKGQDASQESVVSTTESELHRTDSELTVIASPATETDAAASAVGTEHDDPEDETDIVLADLPKKKVPEAIEVPRPDKNIIEHGEYCTLVIGKAREHRGIRRTHDPRLYRHARIPLKHICLYGGLDDGVRICSPGVLWMYDDRVFSVAVIASLGWAPSDRNSEDVTENVPIYVIVRHVSCMTTPIAWSQLMRVLVTKFFRQGRPTANVDVRLVDAEEKRKKKFLHDQQNSTVDQWEAVPTLLTSKEKQDKVREKAAASDNAAAAPSDAQKARELKAARKACTRKAKKEEREALKEERARNDRREKALLEKVRRKDDAAYQRRRRALEKKMDSKIKAATTKQTKLIKDLIKDQFELHAEDVRGLVADSQTEL